MSRSRRCWLFIALLSLAQAPLSGAADAPTLVQKIQAELENTVEPVDAKRDSHVPRGEILHGSINDSAIFPGTQNDFQVYVPAQYDPARPACLLVKLDGLGDPQAIVLDNLIAKREVPVMIAVGISPGAIWQDPEGTPNRRALRFNRSYEFDSLNDHFPDYVLTELMPAVRKMKTSDGRPIIISDQANDRAATGSSTGGIGSFTLAWRRPDQFSRVYDMIGTFVSMRGGHEYPALIRKTEPKPIRIFLEDGSTDAWNPLFGSWYEANLAMESALTFSGYDVAHAWGHHGHDNKPGTAIFPNVMRWLWRDYPAPITAGVSQNKTLGEILPDKSGWQKLPGEFVGAASLAANAQGDVYLSDPAASAVYRLPPDGPAVNVLGRAAVAGIAFGPEGTLYGLIPAEKKIIAMTAAKGDRRTVAEGIAGRSVAVSHDGVILVSEPGEHSDLPSRIWRIMPSGEKQVLDQGLASASGIAFSPDHGLFFAAEKTTKWIYSFIVRPDGTLADKQPFYWLHLTDLPNDSGAEEMAVDTHGTLYVATRMGVQVCDHNGRVRAILPLPTPCGPVRGICFGGKSFDTLFVTDGRQVFKRLMKISGIAPWSKPVAFPSEGPGD